MTPRYAIYFAPEKWSPWWLFGAHWLGRDDCNGALLPQPVLDGFGPDEMVGLTTEPRRYGFHATVKAPFRLVDGCDEATLLQRLQTLAVTLAPVPLGPLRVTTLSGFVALVPEAVSADLQNLAGKCVSKLDDLRAPLSRDDLIKRRVHTLDEREAQLLTLYGYPYVMERFRLHLTLTGQVDLDVAQRIKKMAAAKVQELNALSPLILDRLCLFVEKSPGAPFLRLADILLKGPTA